MRILPESSLPSLVVGVLALFAIFASYYLTLHQNSVILHYPEISVDSDSE